MSRFGTTESGSQVAGEDEWRRANQPWKEEGIDTRRAQELRQRWAAEQEGAALGGSAAATVGPHAMGGVTGGDLGGTGAPGLGAGGAGGGGSMGDTGYHGATGIAGRVGDYAGVRHGGEDKTGVAGEPGFGQTAAAAHSYAAKAHGMSTAAAPNNGYSSGLGDVGAQGAGAGVETAALATGGRAGMYSEEEHVDPYETGVAGGGGGDAAGDEP